jgi:outer membrane lipoprotein-sorting protein
MDEMGGGIHKFYRFPGGRMIIFKTMLVAALTAFALVFATGCQQKSPEQKAGESVGQRAEESGKIITDAAKRVHDSVEAAKKQ